MLAVLCGNIVLSEVLVRKTFLRHIVSIASQANVGGSTSALALARSLNRSDLLLPAIVMGSLGYGIGTYLGFLVAEFIV